MNMRPGPNNKQRGRGRGRGKHHGGGGGGGGGGGPRHQSQNQDQVFNIHRTIDSNGPDVKIRGNAHHIYEKYLQLARDANSSGDRIMAENYLQHAEHYYRLIMAYQVHMQQQQSQGQPYGNGNHQNAQAAHYGSGPYRQGGSGPQPGVDANGNVYENTEASTNGNGEAIVTSTQEDVYNEEDQGRYD